MIFLDCDGVCIDFKGTAKKHFGIELKHNEFGKWKWGKDGYPTPEEFYKVAEAQPWLNDLLLEIGDYGYSKFITKDFAEIKKACLSSKTQFIINEFIEEPYKPLHCHQFTDLLIDDNLKECKLWRKSGGMAYHFDLADNDPFGKFLKFWRQERNKNIEKKLYQETTKLDTELFNAMSAQKHTDACRVYASTQLRKMLGKNWADLKLKSGKTLGDEVAAYIENGGDNEPILEFMKYQICLKEIERWENRLAHFEELGGEHAIVGEF